MTGFLGILALLLGAAIWAYLVLGSFFGDSGPPPSTHTFAPRDRHDKPTGR